VVPAPLDPNYAYGLSELRKQPRLHLMIYMEKAFSIPRSKAANPQWEGVFSGDIRSPEACVEVIWQNYQEKGWAKGTRLSSTAPRPPKGNREEEEEESPLESGEESPPVQTTEEPPEKPAPLKVQEERRVGPMTIRQRGTRTSISVSPQEDPPHQGNGAGLPEKTKKGDKMEAQPPDEPGSAAELLEIPDGEDLPEEIEEPLPSLSSSRGTLPEGWGEALRETNQRLDLALDLLRHLTTVLLSTLVRGRLPITDEDVDQSLTKITRRLQVIASTVDYTDDLPGTTYPPVLEVTYQEEGGTTRHITFEPAHLLDERLFPSDRLHRIGSTLGLDLRRQDRVVSASLIVSKIAERQAASEG
jgi:hypothetical protein